MALAIASVPILSGEASDRFDLMMEESEKRRGSIDFSKQIEQARDILSKADFYLSNKSECVPVRASSNINTSSCLR